MGLLLNWKMEIGGFLSLYLGSVFSALEQAAFIPESSFLAL